jgi:hypothetical protein
VIHNNYVTAGNYCAISWYYANNHYYTAAEACVSVHT